MIKNINNEGEMKKFGKSVGQLLCGGEIIELIGDVGAGKTTFVKGVATGLSIDENIQSPSFTINRVYDGRDSIILSHYDFYRLNNAGIMADEISEVIGNKNTVTIIEWGGAISEVLPDDRLSINIVSLTENSRQLTISSNGIVSGKLEKEIQT